MQTTMTVDARRMVMQSYLAAWWRGAQPMQPKLTTRRLVTMQFLLLSTNGWRKAQPVKMPGIFTEYFRSTPLKLRKNLIGYGGEGLNRSVFNSFLPWHDASLIITAKS